MFFEVDEVYVSSVESGQCLSMELSVGKSRALRAEATPSTTGRASPFAVVFHHLSLGLAMMTMQPLVFRCSRHHGLM